MDSISIVPESIQIIKMTDEEYFSAKYKDYISNSKLSLINPDQNGSPELYKEGITSKYSDSFELGSVIHAMLLQCDSYRVNDIRKPSGKLGQFADKVYTYENEGLSREEAIEKASIDADYYAGKLTQKRLDAALETCIPYWEQRKEYETESNLEEVIDLYVSDAIFNKYSSCMDGIKVNKKFNKLLKPEHIFEPAEVFNEYAILAEIDVQQGDEIKRIKIKAKLDNFTIDHENETVTLNDLKTTGKLASYFMGNLVRTETGEEVWYDGSFQKYHYYRQMGKIYAPYYRNKIRKPF